MKKTIITVVGHDTVGIIAKVCTYLADNNINILDISQTIVQGYFNMMMIVDMNHTGKPFRGYYRQINRAGRRNRRYYQMPEQKKSSVRCTGFESKEVCGMINIFGSK